MRALFPRVRKKSNFIIVVSGLPRSGTSMMMDMLKAGGYPILVDNIRQPDVDNPRGYFEYEPVKQLKTGNSSWLEHAKGHAVKVVSPLLKYLPDDRDYRVLFMQRNKKEMVASQNKLIDHNARVDADVSQEELLAIYDRHLEDIFKWMEAQKSLRHLELSYNAILQKPAYHIDRIEYFLEIKLDKNAMAQVIDPALQHNHSE